MLFRSLGRLTDAARAQRSAEVAHRSRVELGDSGLAKVNNFPTVTKLIAAAAGPDLAKLNGAAPTLNVYVTLEELRAGRGVGWVDGIVDPVPISTVDHLLCHSDFIATVFGQNGQVLHHGKTRRLFDAKQNRALAARDGGCVWPSCDRPPSWCESHHVEDWRSADYAPGRTDIDNGALLCHFHHAHLHKSAWKLIMKNGKPHIIPPPWLDWRQIPRPCGQQRAGIASPGKPAA